MPPCLRPGWRSDFQICLDLAEKLGKQDLIFPNWNQAKDAFEEIRRISRGRLCDYSGMTYEKMLDQGGIQWPCNEANPDGADSLYVDGLFKTEDGRAKLLYTSSEALPEEVDGSYRLILNTGRTVEQWHTGTKTRNVPLLNKLAPEAWVEVNPATAKYYEIGPHDRVSLVSRRGRVDNLMVRIAETIHPDHVFMPFHYAEKCINKLTFPAFDPKSGEPNYKQCAVQLERYRG